MREIDLVSWDDVHQRLDNIKKSFESIYRVELSVEIEDVPLDRLHPTEKFLEKDKLALIFLKVVREGYNVPIIAVKQGNDYFIVDGHHRSFISSKMKAKTIRAYVLIFPQNKIYRTHPKSPLGGLPIKDVAPLDDPLLRTWAQILTLLKYYEALYDMSFTLRKDEVPLRDLVPTQPQTRRSQIDSIIEISVPIVCVKHGGKYFILDGHARSLRAKQLGLDFIEVIVLSPSKEMDFGIVKTAKELNLGSLEDVKVAE